MVCKHYRLALSILQTNKAKVLYCLTGTHLTYCPAMSGAVNIFEISFDKNEPVFREGDDICGIVRVVTEQAIKYKAIRLELCGIAIIHWDRRDSDSDNEREVDEKFSGRTSKEMCYHEKITLTKGGNLLEDSTLEPGEHVYSFESKLPQELPSTFEGEMGQIRYLVKATIDRPYKSNIVTKRAFSLISGLDLNFLPEAANKIEVCKYETFRSCCMDYGSITIDWSVPTSGYVPGQYITVHGAVQNESKFPVHLTSVVLYLVVLYKVGKRQKKKLKKIVSVEKGLTDRGETIVWQEELHIPPLPPSGLDRCDVIDISYELHFTALIEGKKSPVKFIKDIYIGTVPINRAHMRSCMAAMYNQPFTNDSTEELTDEIHASRASELSLTQLVAVASAIEIKPQPTAPALPTGVSRGQELEQMMTSSLLSEAELAHRPPPFAPGCLDSQSYTSARCGSKLASFRTLDPLSGSLVEGQPVSMRNLYIRAGDSVSHMTADSPDTGTLEVTYASSEWGPVSLQDASDDSEVYGDVTYQPMYTYYTTVKPRHQSVEESRAILDEPGEV